ncbi:polysaccharide lyase family 1 protein [Cesiribacter sp. SM1]|uniref:pectate lyase family protein n=1 Tax=Cesiribacter sp. SM1 TaxID=2861196 RepID=UPI00351D0E54
MPVQTADKALAFPGAEGFGRYTTGGRGGKVVVVTNLNDSGPGSLREALRMKEPRIVVFAVAGTIELESSLDINTGNLTIAGQSAPGDGITLRNFPMKIKGDNVIVRYLRFRMGDKKGHQGDAISATGRNNIIVDHASMSWGTDEGASFYNNKNFTLQWSIISESLNESVHEKGAHGYGGIWGGVGASFHHNLLAHLKSRTPRFSGSSTTANSENELVDFRNNIIYNWKDNSVYGGERGRYNMVGNYYKPGPATKESKQDRIVEPYEPYGQFYVADNYVNGFPEVSRENRKGVDIENPDAALVATAFPVEPVTDQPAAQAYEQVLSEAGASLVRDAVDSRIIQDVRNGSAALGKDKDGIIDSQDEAGGWPQLKAGVAPSDKDLDGMPDSWEQKHRLNPDDAADASGYTLDDSYTNIEVYLNELVNPA